MSPKQKQNASFLILAAGAMITLAFRSFNRHDMGGFYITMAIGALCVVTYVVTLEKPDA